MIVEQDTWPRADHHVKSHWGQNSLKPMLGPPGWKGQHQRTTPCLINVDYEELLIQSLKSEIIGKKLSISVAYPCLQLGGQIAHEGAQVGLQEAIIERAHNLQPNLIKHQSIWVRRLHPMCWSELCWLVWCKQPGPGPSVLRSWASLQVGRQKWRPAERHDMCPWAEWYGMEMKQDKINYF